MGQSCENEGMSTSSFSSSKVPSRALLSVPVRILIYMDWGVLVK